MPQPNHSFSKKPASPLVEGITGAVFCLTFFIPTIALLIWCSINNLEATRRYLASDPGEVELPLLQTLFMGLLPVFLGLVSALIGVAMLSGKSRGKILATRKTRYPDEPLLWRPDWAAGQSECDLFNSRWLAVISAIIFFSSIGWSAVNLWLWQHEWRWIGVGMGLLGIFFVVWIFRDFRSWRHNRGVVLHFDEPLTLGGSHSVKIRKPRGAITRQNLTWELVNSEIRTGTGETDDSVSTTFSTTPVRVVDRSISELTLQFDIPADGFATNLFEDYGDGVSWKLQGQGRMLTIGPFELPVLREGDAKGNARAEIPELEQFQNRIAKQGIVMRSENEAVVFEAMPNPETGKQIRGALIFGIMILIGSIVALFFDLPGWAWIVSFCGILTGLGSIISAIVHKTSRSEVRSTSDQITVRYSIVGKSFNLVFKRSEIDSIRAELRTKNSYRVAIKKNDGTGIPIPPSFRNRHDCEMMASFLQ